MLPCCLLLLTPPSLAGPPGAEGDIYVGGYTGSMDDLVFQYDLATFDLVGPFADGAGQPDGLVFGPNGDLFATNNNQVFELDGATGVLVRVFAYVGGGTSPTGLTYGPNGNLFVICTGAEDIREFDGGTGAFLGVFTSGGGLDNPRRLVFGPNGNLLVTSQPQLPNGSPDGPGSVLEYDGTTGAFVGVFATGPEMEGLMSLAFGPNGNLFVGIYDGTYDDPSNNILEYDGTTGEFLGVFADAADDDGISYPHDLAWAPNGNLVVSEWHSNHMFEFDGATGERLKDEAICYGPTSMTIKPPCPAFTPQIAGFEPAQADNCGMLAGATITGSGLSAPCGEFKLVKSGEADIVAAQALSGLPLLEVVEADFDLSGVATGMWDVVVSYPDGPSDTLVGVLEVTQCAGPVVTGFYPAQQGNCGLFVGAVISGTNFTADPQPTVKLTCDGQPDIPGAITDFTPPTIIVADFDIGGVELGLWDVVVTNPDSQSGTLEDALEVTECVGPVVTGFAPGSVDNCEPLTGATITGSAFLPGSTVKLSKAGEPDVEGTNVEVQTALTIVADFDVTMALAGLWDVVVTHPEGGPSSVLEGGLEILSCPPPEVSTFSQSVYDNCTWLIGATVTGEYFTPGMTLVLSKAGEPDVTGKNVEFASADTLTADFRLTDASPGLWDLVVTRPDGQSGTLAGAVEVRPCEPACLVFANLGFPVLNYSHAIGQPSDVVFADFDDDGVPDMATPNRGSLYPDSSVSVFFGCGDGTFTAERRYLLELGPGEPLVPRRIVTGDLDGDGDVDIAVAGDYYVGSLPSGGTVCVLRNQGDGTFAPFELVYGPISDPVYGGYFSDLEIGDLDGDADLDLVVPFVVLGSYNVTVLFNDGDATFGTSVDVAVAAYPRAVEVGDLDDDDDLDIAVAVSAGSVFCGMSLLFNAGDGAFPNRFDYSAACDVKHITLDDLDGDDDLDFVLVTRYGDDSRFAIAFNTGGVPSAWTYYDMAGPGEFATTGDLDADGDVDIVTCESYAHGWEDEIAVYMNDGSGTFGPGVTYHVGTRPRAIAVGDANGDGSLDLAVVNYASRSVSVLLNLGGGVFASDQLFPVGNHDPESVKGLSAGDLDGDGDLDLVGTVRYPYLNPGGGQVFALLNDGSGSYSQSWTYDTSPYETYSRYTALGDLDGDGNLDLVEKFFDMYSDPVVRSLWIWFGNGDGTFAEPPVSYEDRLQGPAAVLMADLNGDDALDLVVPSWPTSDVRVLLNQGDGTFGAASDYPVEFGPFAGVLGDLTGDDAPDLVMSNGYALSVLVNHGDGTFEDEVTYPIGDLGASALAIADLDGDGDLDVGAASDRKFSIVSVVLNNGDGTLADPVTYATRAKRVRSLVAGDLDGDGDVDLAAAEQSRGVVYVLLNNGDATFDHLALAYGIGAAPRSLVIGDLDADGRLDLASGSMQGLNEAPEHRGALSVLLNRACLFAIPGDLNCDGAVNAYDIDGFICALSPQCDYEALYPDCDRMLADCNGDGDVNAYDIDAFIALIGGG